MVYKRKGRPTWSFQARTETGWKQLSTGASAKPLAARIESMWESLASDARAWDVLGDVLAGRLAIGRLYDLWTATRHDVGEIRRRLSDTDLQPIVAEFLAAHAKRVKPDSLAHIETHLRTLIPGASRFRASEATTERLYAAVYGYRGKRNTLRKVHSSLSVFFAYLTDVKKLYARNPMDEVGRPPKEKSPIRFYELDVVERIVGWQPSAERRALFAFLYGTGVEISVALTLTRADVWPNTKEVRAPGTKAHTRDRVARVADWAWPAVWAHVESMHAQTRLFPVEWSRWTCSDWHRQAVGEGVKDTHGKVLAKGLELHVRLPMYNARHHWAVRRLRSGSSVQDVQRQLGHESPQLTLETYGQFMPSAEDRDRAEIRATQYESERRSAKGGANAG